MTGSAHIPDQEFAEMAEHLVPFDLVQRFLHPVPELLRQFKPDSHLIQIFPLHQRPVIRLFAIFQIELFQLFIYFNARVLQTLPKCQISHCMLLPGRSPEPGP